MGHYASEMRSDEDQKRIDNQRALIERLLKRRFTKGYTGEHWNCGECGAQVEEGNADKHFNWHKNKA